MKLWLVQRTDPVGYSEFQGFVIRAETQMDARKMASAGRIATPTQWQAEEPSPNNIWFAASTQVTELLAVGEALFIMADYTGD